MSTYLRLTTAEYDQMVLTGAFDHINRRIELIRGEIREMNPAGPLHDDHILYLNDWSMRTTANESIRVAAQLGLALDSTTSRPEPDIAWVRAARYRDQHPTAEDVRLVIEVSVSSLKSDLIEKASLYAESGIVEYWVVDATGKCIHVFRSPNGNEYSDRSVAKSGEYLSPLHACSEPLDLQDLFE